MASGIVQSFRNVMPDLIGSRRWWVLHFILSSHLQFGSTDLDSELLSISQDKLIAV